MNMNDIKSEWKKLGEEHARKQQADIDRLKAEGEAMVKQIEVRRTAADIMAASDAARRAIGATMTLPEQLRFDAAIAIGATGAQAWAYAKYASGKERVPPSRSAFTFHAPASLAGKAV